MTVKDTIQEKLSKKELHKLFSLCKKYYPLPLRVLEGQEKYLAKHRKDSLGPNCYKKLLEVRKIHGFYQKAGVAEADYIAHWTTERTIQRIKHDEYKNTLKPERKDNKTYINRGNGDARHSIRYPKKVRKTAWKRFYRLFPFLDPERENKPNE
jgi:hypothetical protein